MRRVRGFKAMVHDAVDATVELVREGNESAARSVRRIAAPVPVLGEAVHGVDDVRRVVTAGVLGSVRAINHVVAHVSDTALDVIEAKRDEPPSPLTPVALQSDGAWFVDAASGVLNAIVGEHLGDVENTLGITMQLRVKDTYLDANSPASAWREALFDVSEHVVVLVHGLGVTERSWAVGALHYHGDPHVNLGTELERELGATALHVRYNTGYGPAHNGDSCAALLELLVTHMARSTARLTLIGHSMGGLVLRHACHTAERDDLRFGALVQDVFYLGSPHQGAPLAALGEAITRGFGMVDLPATRVLSNLFAGRSAGTKELAQGMTMARRVDLPLEEHAVHHFILGTVTSNEHGTSSRFLGDLLVRTSSASGSEVRASTLSKRVKHHGRLLHHQLQNHPAVLAHILDVLGASPD